MRFSACLLLIALCLFGPGCALFKKNTDSKPPAGGSATPPAKFPTSNDPLINGGNASAGRGSAVLAGRVIDNFSKPPANTSIRLVCVDGKDTTTPSEVNVGADGYFTIMGLKSGSSYRLVARGKNGDRMVAGITQTKAPNLTVVIQVKEEFANSSTPELQGSPAFEDKNKSSATDKQSNNSDKAVGLNGPRGNEMEMPAVNVPGPGGQTSAVIPAHQGWTPAPDLAQEKGNIWPPPLEIPNPASKPAPPPLLIPKTSPALPQQAPIPVPLTGDNRLDGPARVPSCVLVGKQLVNFALNDVNGEPWEFKRNRKGKLVLIDFWSTTCVPCVETMPTLRKLQTQYGNQGLEVIGIAIESGGSPQLLGYRVNAMAERHHLNYRQLLSTSAQCPVCTQLQIERVPTTILVDQDGNILWRHLGKPDGYALRELEQFIQRRLRS